MIDASLILWPTLYFTVDVKILDKKNRFRQLEERDLMDIIYQVFNSQNKLWPFQKARPFIKVWQFHLFEKRYSFLELLSWNLNPDGVRRPSHAWTRCPPSRSEDGKHLSHKRFSLGPCETGKFSLRPYWNDYVN